MPRIEIVTQVFDGKYTDIELLAEGGMSTIYKAVKPNLGAVAIKVLKSAYATDPDMVARFHKEATTLWKLDHHNIIDVYDLGTKAAADGTKVHFMVMEFINGVDVQVMVQRIGRPLTLDEARPYLLPILDALGYLHDDEKLVHRDIKSSNILISTDPERPEWFKPVLIDFGVVMDRSGAFKTRKGVSFFTPEYMSKEQAKGESNLDRRTDLYSLGVVLFEMLTGQVPFTSDNDLLTIEMVKKNPTPSPRSHVKGISKDVEELLMKALAKDRDDRFQTADEMAAALREGKIGKSAKPHKAHSPQKTAKGKPGGGVKLDPVKLAVIGLAVCVLLIAAVLVFKNINSSGQGAVAERTPPSPIDEPVNTVPPSQSPQPVPAAAPAAPADAPAQDVPAPQPSQPTILANVGNGKTVWVSYDAMFVDGSQKIWLNSKAKYGTSKSSSRPVKVQRTSRGFVVDIRGLSHQWTTQSVSAGSLEVSQLIHDTPAIADMAVGQSGWVSPDTMYPDTSNRLWLKPGVRIRPSRSSSNCMQVFRNGSGADYTVDIKYCSGHQWEQVASHSSGDLPVGKLLQ